MARDAAAQVGYAPWTTFNSALDKLHDKGLPERLDRTVFAGQSGGTQAILMATMRAIGGIDEDGTVQPLLHRLVNPAQRTAALKEVIDTRYGAIMALSPTATQGQFDQAFTDYGVGGATRRKAQAFFLAAAETVGIKLSSHIRGATAGPKANSAPKASGTNTPARKRRGGKGSGRGDGDTINEQTGRAPETGVLFHPAVDSFLREARKLTEGPAWTQGARDRVIAGFTTQIDLFLPVTGTTRATPPRKKAEPSADDGAAES